MGRLGLLGSLLAPIVAAGAMAAPAHAAAPLLGQWPLDSSHVVGPNDVTDDVSGNGLALTAASGSTRFDTAGQKFGLGDLSAANATLLEVDSPLLAPPAVTLLAWVRQNGYPGNLRYIAGRGDDGATCGGSSYALYSGYAAKPGLHFYVRTPTTSGLSDSPADAAVFDNQWHLVAGTFDGSSVRLYVDGNPVGTPQSVPDGIDYNLGGSTKFYLDGYPVPACGVGDWPGAIDEVRVYDRALTQTELARLSAAPGPTAPDLVPDDPGTPQLPGTPSQPSTGSSPPPSGTPYAGGNSLNQPIGSLVAALVSPKRQVRVLPGGRVDVPITCPPTALNACTGTVTLTYALPPPRRATRRGGGHKKPAPQPRKVVLGSARFSVPPGRTADVIVQLSRAGRKLLTDQRRLACVLSVVTRITANRSFTTTRAVTLVAPKQAKRRQVRRQVRPGRPVRR